MTRLNALEWLIRWNRGEALPNHVFVNRLPHIAGFNVFTMDKSNVVHEPILIGLVELQRYQLLIRETRLCKLFLGATNE